MKNMLKVQSVFNDEFEFQKLEKETREYIKKLLYEVYDEFLWMMIIMKLLIKKK